MAELESKLAAALRRVGDDVTPSDVRMLRDLARESRLMAVSAYPDRDAIVHRQRERARIRGAFVADARLHLGLLCDLAAKVRRRLDDHHPARRVQGSADDRAAEWRARAQERVEPDDVRMLGQLASEARLLVCRALAGPPAHLSRCRTRRPHWARLAFLADAIRHLELLDELARIVEGKLWDDE